MASKLTKRWQTVRNRKDVERIIARDKRLRLLRDEVVEAAKEFRVRWLEGGRNWPCVSWFGWDTRASQESR